MLNVQPAEKPVSDIYRMLDVHSIFPTIQGEGPHVGRPAVFIRLAGCNLQCPLCDTDYTKGRHPMLIGDILRRVVDIAPPNSIAVITGGEPFRQELGSFILDLIELAGMRVQVETNGTLPPPASCRGLYDIVCSPKAGKVHPEIEAQALAYKYVVRHGYVNPVDGLPTHALDHPAHPQVARPPARLPRANVYIQPCDEGVDVFAVSNLPTNSRNLTAAMNSAMQFGYTLGIQLHKYLGVQ